MSVRAIYFEEKAIGEHIKKTKKQYIWKFEIDGLQHTIEFLASKLTGKKKVFQDGVSLLEQKKLTKNFEFPFSIGKHMCTIIHNSKETDLRIDSNAFKNLYNGSRFDDMGYSMKSYAAPKAPRPAQLPPSYNKKKVPDEWVDIKDAKQSIKYDDIPDPYSMSKKTSLEDKKSQKKLDTVNSARHQKSNTIIKKPKKADFFDDFGDSKQKKSTKKNDEFDFDFGAAKDKDKNKKTNVFDFDDFDNNLPKKNDKPKISNDWSEGIMFDDSQPQKPSKPSVDDIFGTGMLQPSAETAASTNPFDMFSAKPEPKPKKKNPFISNDVFQDNNSFPTTFTSNGSWGSANFNNPTPTQPPLYSKTQDASTVQLSHLNPFSENQNINGSSGGVLPPGVNSADLFS